MYRLSFELVQHTPIIHFQADYQGATLRASEVKPKLDKFLLKCFKRDKISIPNNWLIPGQKDALSYKLSFLSVYQESTHQRYLPLSESKDKKKDIADNPRKEQECEEEQKRQEGIKVLAPSPYFANQEGVKGGEIKGELVTFAVMSSNKIEGKIYTKHSVLLEELRKYLPEFFVLHNFGARQTKGFGSFTIGAIDGEGWHVDENLPKAFAERQVYLLIGDSGSETIEDDVDEAISKVFDLIQDKHRKIKTKSLREYLGGKTERDLCKSLLNHQKPSDPGSYVFARALLGLTNVYSFRGKGKKKVSIRVKYNRRRSKSQTNTIERFPTPLLYKPISIDGAYKVYIIAQPIPKQMRGAAFDFCAPQMKQVWVRTSKDFKLTTFLSSKDCAQHIKKL
ncbi:hypothetical protein HQ41_03985 [Porphyromonas sp. COT-290 OH860]|nr:hypothetical protein HQ41_03985 [Porphyromonas sp. COT-290 OH860]